jgi:hypothetical protein
MSKLLTYALILIRGPGQIALFALLCGRSCPIVFTNILIFIMI